MNHKQDLETDLLPDEELLEGLVLHFSPAERRDAAFIGLHLNPSYLNCLRAYEIKLYCCVVIIYNKSTL